MNLHLAGMTKAHFDFEGRFARKAFDQGAEVRGGPSDVNHDGITHSYSPDSLWV